MNREENERSEDEYMDMKPLREGWDGNASPLVFEQTRAAVEVAELPLFDFRYVWQSISVMIESVVVRKIRRLQATAARGPVES